MDRLTQLLLFVLVVVPPAIAVGILCWVLLTLVRAVLQGTKTPPVE